MSKRTAKDGGYIGYEDHVNWVGFQKVGDRLEVLLSSHKTLELSRTQVRTLGYWLTEAADDLERRHKKFREANP